MKLKDWMAVNEVTRPAFAIRIGKSAESVRRYEEDLRIPDRDAMAAIARETEGEVTANDFFDIEASDSAEAA